MEAIFVGSLYKSKSSNSAIPSQPNKSQNRNLSAGDVGRKMGTVKKRGVYVERWVNTKYAGDNKKNLSNVQPPRPETTKLLTSAPAESKISTYTRLLGTADPTVRYIKRKSTKTLPKLPGSFQTAKQSKHESKPRNIVEENKKKLKSNALKQIDAESIDYQKDVLQKASTSSRLNRDLSQETYWSSIFPNTESSKSNTNLLQQYISYDQTRKPEDKDLDKSAENGKDEPIYNFFVDLLESVYDDNNTDITDTISEKSEVKFEIDDHVAQKLLSQEDTVQYTIKNEHSTQSRELAEYYNNSSQLAAPRKRRKKTINKCFPCIHKSAYTKEEKAPKKQNLLSLLKQQLSLDNYMQEEPESMYEALLSIAKNKQKRKRIYFETNEPSDRDTCRFKRRNVISASTRMPKKKSPKFNSFNLITSKYRTGSDASINESHHSLEVWGFDYNEADIVEPDSDTEFEMETAKKPILNLNEGIMTITQYWKR